MKDFLGIVLMLGIVFGTVFGVIYATRDHNSAQSLGLQIGDRVLVTEGFYKDCMGILTDYDDYSSMTDEVKLEFISCPMVQLSYLRVEADQVQKVNR